MNLVDLDLFVYRTPHIYPLHIPRRYGDCLQAGWTNILDLVTCFYRLQMLPESFSKALNGDGDVSVGEKEEEEIGVAVED